MNGKGVKTNIDIMSMFFELYMIVFTSFVLLCDCSNNEISTKTLLDCSEELEIEQTG